MAAAAAGSVLSAAPVPRASVRFALATPADDAALRRLLRESPMAGRISISLEREPDYFAASAIEGPEHQTIVAYENGQLACAGNISARQRFINGKPMRIGYLGGLRLGARFRGRTDIVRRGYRMFRQLHEQGGPPVYLTSIAEDNEPARRLLERGIKGLPTYRFLGRFVTFIVPRRAPFSYHGWAEHALRKKGIELADGTDADVPALVALLRRKLADYQFAPAWTVDDLAFADPKLALRADDFCIARASGSGEMMACAAMWDQRSFKQSVVRGYHPMLQYSRYLLNILSAWLRGTWLPPIGGTISSVFVSHLAADDDPVLLRGLLNVVRNWASGWGAQNLVIGLDARDPRVAVLRLARPREYVTRLYAVHFDDGAELAASLDDRLLAPEVATL